MSKPNPEIEEVVSVLVSESTPVPVPVSEEESDEEEKKCLCGAPEQEYDHDGDDRDYARYLFCNYLSHGEHATEENFDEFYRGRFDSPEEFAKEQVESCEDLESTLPPYIYRHLDWDGIASDLMADYFEEDGHYFRCL